jgi:osmotically inducible protein OsmC
MTAKTIYTGKTHYQSGPDGFARSADGLLDIELPEPHPAAENLFGAAWAACYVGAIGLSAQQRKIALPTPPSVDAEIGLSLGKDGFFLSAKFAVSIPGVDTDVAQELIAHAHTICPYSKAVHGNIEVETVLV